MFTSQYSLFGVRCSAYVCVRACVRARACVRVCVCEEEEEEECLF